MTDQLISYNTAVLAREKGYPLTPADYEWSPSDGNIPTQSLLQRWLREVHGIHIEMEYNVYFGGYSFMVKSVATEEVIGNSRSFGRSGFTSYEETLEAGLVEALTIVTKPF